MTPISVFIVDDNPVFARLLQVRLTNAGSRFAVHVFLSGEQCLAHLHLQPQLLLLDYQLGGEEEEALNGRQVLGVLRECAWKPQVIFMSSRQELELLQSGALAFIYKDKNAFAKLDAVLAAYLSGENPGNQPPPIA